MSWFKQNAPPEQGSLAALGGGMPTNGGGMNDGGQAPTPYPFPDPFGQTRNPSGQSDYPYKPIPGTDWGGNPIPTNPDGTIQLGGNRGNGQPINLPVSSGSSINVSNVPQPMGSLQALGGGQLNQSGMVNLRGPDGSMKAVPQDQVQHWLSKGATQVGGGSGEQMVNNGWGRMVPKSQQDAFYASGGRT